MNVLKSKMNKITKVRVPPHLILTGILSSCITLVVSVIYIALSTFALVYRNNCDLGSLDIDGSGFFLTTLFRVYIQKDDCPNSLQWEGVTEADSVFLLVIVTMTASCLATIVAIAFIIVLCYEDASRYVQLVAYLYVGVCVASLVVDVTFGTHFGIDYSNINTEMNLNSPGLNMNYTKDMVRLAAFALMTISLKGFVAHVINIVLLILIAVYVADYQKLIQKDEHSIHKLGALNAFEQQRRQEDVWQPSPEMFLGLSRGPQVNPAYLNDDEPPLPSPMREQPASDYSSRLYDRSESWQPGPTTGARPFSYLEEAKRPVPVRPPTTTPAAGAESQWNRNHDNQWNRNHEPQWNRNQWPPAPAPPVPAPDYSPQNGRRLKSALKPAYM